MNLIVRIGDDTIARLEGAARGRLAEATDLTKLGHRMTAIYLCGYAAESLIGSAYFRLVGLSANDVINKERLHNYLKAARQFIQVSDTAHPLDGESRFLINQSVLLRRPGYPSLFSREIISRVDSICCHWSHKLRYRAILADETQADEVIRATRWLLDNHSDM